MTGAYSVICTLAVAVCLIVAGFVALSYLLVAADVLARRWFRWRHRIRRPRRWRFRSPVFRIR